MQPRKPAMRVTPEGFAAVIRGYLASPKFAQLAPGTRANYRHLLDLAALPNVLAAVPVTVIRPALTQAYLDGLADKPGAQSNARVALKAVERWAIVRDLLPNPITLGTEVIGGGDGHRPWSEQQIEIAVEYGRPDLARAILLASHSGQRGSDLIKMRWNDLEMIDGRVGVNVVQRKTGLRIWVPLTKAMSTTLEAWERVPGPILRMLNGQPWSERRALSKVWEKERPRNPNLAPCRDMRLHGLRATACVRLSRLGCTTREISDMVGLSEPMVARYCRYSEQKQNAMAAVLRLDGTRWQQSDQIRK